MDRIKSIADLAHALAELESQGARSLDVTREMVERLMSKWPNDRGIFVELRKLSDFIHRTRTELAALRPSEMKQQFIPKATDELDAIVEATASATHRIMDAADVIMDAAGRMAGPDADKVNNAVTSIFEACTFQDITGQRVTKIVAVLKAIESRVDKMIEALGEFLPPPIEAEAAAEVASTQDDIDALFATGPSTAGEDGSKGSLLHGPALPGQGATQADIDALFGKD